MRMKTLLLTGQREKLEIRDITRVKLENAYQELCKMRDPENNKKAPKIIKKKRSDSLIFPVPP